MNKYLIDSSLEENMGSFHVTFMPQNQETFNTCRCFPTTKSYNLVITNYNLEISENSR